MKKLILFVFLVGFLCQGFGQQLDSLAIKPEKEPDLKLEKTTRSSEWPNPNKAILFAIIPGGGQIYNKRWWKLPLVYGAIAGGIWVIDYNRGFYIRFRDALNLSREGLPHEFSELGFTSTTLKIKRDLANKYMQQAFLATFAIYVLQGTEAFVDAHLRNFDIDEDLGFNITPNVDFLPEINQPIVGLSLTIPISR
ncbi:MAG: hypothetical protein KDC85_07685 [Saprospiraceae bacterium]|nr:hypothetical protein [Saprospiraceae bacterium]MCB9322322.1 hypothetical protein [Lewinellaceae bacterium]